MDYKLKSLIYLWTRDSGKPVNMDTKNEVFSVLQHIEMQHQMDTEDIYADKDREQMAMDVIEVYEKFAKDLEEGTI